MAKYRIGLIVLSAVAGLATASNAAVVCVDTSAGLQTALSDASANNEADTIHVVQGTYLTLGGPFYHNSSQNFDLEILGGYTPGCAGRELDPTNTEINGQGTDRLLWITTAPGTSGGILVQGLTFTNGAATDSNPGGVSLGNASGWTGAISFDHNIISNNTSTASNGGLIMGADGSSVRFENNLVVGNSGTIYGAGQIICNGTTVTVTNNTIADNTGTGQGGLRVYVGGTAGYFSNNILWANSGTDLTLGGGTVPLMKNNDWESLSGTIDAQSTGNVTIDPLFAGGSDYRLQATSTLINAGFGTPEGGLPVLDLVGNPRVLDGIVDIGAYEDAVTLVFVDGFETADTSAWSTIVP